MKTRIKEVIALIRSDRALLTLFSIIAVIAVGYVMYVGFSIRPRDIQVAVQYTAFGPTNVYRAPWYYLLLLALFGVMVAVVHSLLMIKLTRAGRRQAAMFLGCITILIQIITIVYSSSILAMATL